MTERQREAQPAATFKNALPASMVAQATRQHKGRLRWPEEQRTYEREVNSARYASSADTGLRYNLDRLADDGPSRCPPPRNASILGDPCDRHSVALAAAEDMIRLWIRVAREHRGPALSA